MKFLTPNKQLELYVYEKLSEYGYNHFKDIVEISKTRNELFTNHEAYQCYTHIMWVAKMKYLHNHPEEKFTNHKIYTQEQFNELKMHIDSIFDS